MRTKLIEQLAYGWREAENHYLETGSDSKKLEMFNKQLMADLTEKELEELDNFCNSMGV